MEQTSEKKMPQWVATAIEMVRSGSDATGPHPGFQRDRLKKRLQFLTDGFAEILEKAPHLFPPNVKEEMATIEDALKS